MENNAVVARVAGQPITEMDLQEAIAQMGARGRNYNTPEGRKAILDQLIAQRLFLADAKKTMMEYDPQFKAQLAKVKDDLLFQFAVKRNGVEGVIFTESRSAADFNGWCVSLA